MSEVQKTDATSFTPHVEGKGAPENASQTTLSPKGRTPSTNKPLEPPAWDDRTPSALKSFGLKAGAVGMGVLGVLAGISATPFVLLVGFGMDPYYINKACDFLFAPAMGAFCFADDLWKLSVVGDNVSDIKADIKAVKDASKGKPLDDITIQKFNARIEKYNIEYPDSGLDLLSPTEGMTYQTLVKDKADALMKFVWDQPISSEKSNEEAIKELNERIEECNLKASNFPDAKLLVFPADVNSLFELHDFTKFVQGVQDKLLKGKQAAPGMENKEAIACLNKKIDQYNDTHENKIKKLSEVDDYQMLLKITKVPFSSIELQGKHKVCSKMLEALHKMKRPPGDEEVQDQIKKLFEIYKQHESEMTKEVFSLLGEHYKVSFAGAEQQALAKFVAGAIDHFVKNTAQ